MNILDQLNDPNTVVLTKSQWDTLGLLSNERNYLLRWSDGSCVIKRGNGVPIRHCPDVDVFVAKGLVDTAQVRYGLTKHYITEAGQAALQQFNGEQTP